MSDVEETPGLTESPAAEKVQRLYQHFSSSSSAQIPVVKKALLEHFFLRAPSSFLEKRDIGELAQIVERANSALLRLSEKQSVVIDASEFSDVSSLIICLKDRPFIINTLSECLREFGLSISVLLHPIVNGAEVSGGIQSGKLSLSYVETPQIAPELHAVLVSRITEALGVLCAVTDDFDRMRAIPQFLSENINTLEFYEEHEFLNWLTEANFVFIGSQNYALGRSDISPQAGYGIHRAAFSKSAELQSQIRDDLSVLAVDNRPLLISRLEVRSPIHRRQRLLHVAVRSGTEFTSIIGLLTSKANGQESSAIPLVRKKLKQVLEQEQTLENSHDYKAIFSVLDRMPKEDAFRLRSEEICGLVEVVLNIHNKNETAVVVCVDELRRAATVFVALPKDRFNNELRLRIQRYLEQDFGSTLNSSEHHLDLSRNILACLYFYLPLTASGRDLPHADQLRAGIEALSQTWTENLRSLLLSPRTPFKTPEVVWGKYAESFSADYKASYNVEDALQDIISLEKLTEKHPISVATCFGSDQECITVYSYASEISASRALPILENAGFEVQSERTSIVSPLNSPPLVMHRFKVKVRTEFVRDPNLHDRVVGPGLEAIFQGKSENDILNTLMITAGLDVQALTVIRAYALLLWQTGKFSSRYAIMLAFVSNSVIAKLIWQLFELRFNPALDLTSEQRALEAENVLASSHEALRTVRDLTSDNALKGAISLVQNSLRTNFYRSRSALAIKIGSAEVPILPLPRPMFEIFVYSAEFEGIHLRSGSISRGGIRWSERPDDYRSEVLSLMKTQKIKNAVIVPEGAKGGFVVKNLPHDSELVPAAVVAAYRSYIRALLSVTDNYIAGTIVTPEGVITYDGEDPYLVVAADKGTAKFSDVANEIATKEFNFWLGDAFASGGSKGYDHKLYGITARGAFESVKRHFCDLGIDWLSNSFTAVGIGDMSGDVFGNGLILSQNIKLIGAFDHRHIFLDPNPDPQIAFQERKRLFGLPRSSWADYQASLISAGGGVFSRLQKEITLSKQVRESLGITEDAPTSVSGEELVTLILSAKCDLLWNGGIGTYVKSQSESNSDVSDGANDRVRINASDLRAKVVGEGGNLGFTQRARVEAALKGIHINTDAIDNSGGVDLSDHEVNLKILFAQLIQQGILCEIERDSLLKSMVPEVIDMVLAHNRNQAFILTLGFNRSKKRLHYFRSLINEVCKLNYLDRKRDCLPDDEELRLRSEKGQGLSRPELAVCLAAVKMLTKKQLLNSQVLADPYFDNYLLEYFPQELRSKFSEQILGHPLALNIKACQVTNHLVDILGISFLHRMGLAHSVAPECVLRSSMAAIQIIRAAEKHRLIFDMDTPNNNSQVITLANELGRALRQITSWIISTHASAQSVSEITKSYSQQYHAFCDSAQELVADWWPDVTAKATQLKELGLDNANSWSFALYNRTGFIFELIWFATSTGLELRQAFDKQRELYKLFGLNEIFELEAKLEPDSRFDQELLLLSFLEMRRSISLLAKKCFDREITFSQLSELPAFQSLRSTISQIQGYTKDVSAIAVLSRQIGLFEAHFL